jgi:hypothetical protein
MSADRKSSTWHPRVEPSIAVIVPCRNEALTVAKVVRDFARVLPGATVYVYDNASTDQTAKVASEAGAIVRHEARPGKGQVVRRMFSDVDADVYVLVDGDATYDCTSAPGMIRRLIEDRLDMVTGVREASSSSAAYRRGHVFGNRAFNALLGALFGDRPADLLSGYRVLSRRYVKSFPALSKGFEIETEMTVHALEQRLPLGEIATAYFERPDGSQSKLSTWRDGIRILRMMMGLFRDERPLVFFGSLSCVAAVLGLFFGVEVVIEFMETHLVSRLPTAILATGLMLTAFLGLACGLILDSVARGRREQKRMCYLAQPLAAYAVLEPQRKVKTHIDGRPETMVVERIAHR